MRDTTPTPRRRVTLRALTILRRLLEGPASAVALIAAAEGELGSDAFGESPLFALRRDLQALRAAGFAVGYDRARGSYALAGQGGLGRLADDQAAALGILVRSANETLPFSGPLCACLAAVVAALPPDLRQRVQRPGLRFDLRADPPMGQHHAVLETLDRALASRHCLRLVYRSASRGVATRRTVEPLDLVLRDRHVYLEAFDGEAGHFRQFRVDRIAEASVLPRVAPQRTSARPAIRLRFRISPRLARHGPSGFDRAQVTPLPDGSALVTAETTSLFWAARALLSYGEHVEVLDPPGLRRELGRIAQVLATRYRGAAGLVAEERTRYDVP
ncbi:MAG: WYL domain-containing protein [Chloroflexi bacterium]|nr:WYL domain-containing protein [Chloroflexota bacterium]